MRPLVFLGICVILVNVLFQNNLIVSKSQAARRRRLKRIRFRPIQQKRQIEVPINLDKTFLGLPPSDQLQSGSPLSRPRSSEISEIEEINSPPMSTDTTTSVSLSTLPMTTLITTESAPLPTTIPEELIITTESSSEIASTMELTTKATTPISSVAGLAIEPSAVVRNSFVNTVVTGDITSSKKGNELMTETPMSDQGILQINPSGLKITAEGEDITNQPSARAKAGLEFANSLDLETETPTTLSFTFSTKTGTIDSEISNDEPTTEPFSTEGTADSSSKRLPSTLDLFSNFGLEMEIPTEPTTVPFGIMEIGSPGLPDILPMTITDDPDLRIESATEVENSEITWRDIQNPFLLGFDYLHDEDIANEDMADEDMDDEDMDDEDMDFYMDLLASEIDGDQLEMAYEDDYLMLDGSFDPLDLESSSPHTTGSVDFGNAISTTARAKSDTTEFEMEMTTAQTEENSLGESSTQEQTHSPTETSTISDMNSLTFRPNITLMPPSGPIRNETKSDELEASTRSNENEELEETMETSTLSPCCPCTEESEIRIGGALLQLMRERGMKSLDLDDFSEIEALLTSSEDFTDLPNPTSTSRPLIAESFTESEVTMITSDKDESVETTTSITTIPDEEEVIVETTTSVSLSDDEEIMSTTSISTKVPESDETTESFSENDAEDLEIISRAVLKVMRARGIKSLKGFSEIEDLLKSAEDFTEAPESTRNPDDEEITTTVNPMEEGIETTTEFIDLETETIASNMTSDEEGENAALLDGGTDLIKETFGRYFKQLKTIYELDLKLLEQLSSILKKVNNETLPFLSNALAPGLAGVQGSNLNLVELVGYLTSVLKKSEFEGAVTTKLRNLDFISLGPLPLPLDPFLDDHFVHFVSKLVLAQFDNTGVGFPVRALLVGPQVFSALKSRSNSLRIDYITTQIISSKIKEFIRATDAFVTVNDGEIIVDSHTGFVNLMDECKVTVSVPSTTVKAKVYGASTLRIAGSVAKMEEQLKTSIILGGDLDVSLNVKGDAFVRLGKKIFHRCFTKYKNNIPLSLLSQGKVWVGARILAKGVRIEDRPAETQLFNKFTNSYQAMPGYTSMQKFLVFKFDLKLNAKILRWNVDHIGLEGCEIRLFGVKVISFCGIIKRTLKDYITRFILEFSEVFMPDVLRKLEQLLRKQIGDEIAIPLLLAEEKTETISTLLQKVESVATLKGDLIRDLSNVASSISDTLG